MTYMLFVHWVTGVNLQEELEALIFFCGNKYVVCKGCPVCQISRVGLKISLADGSSLLFIIIQCNCDSQCRPLFHGNIL